MLEAAVAAMKELVSSGNSATLTFAFTHFDKVSGDNLPNPSARSPNGLCARLKTSRVFPADLDQKLNVESKDGERTASQLGKLLAMIDGIVARPEPIDSHPICDRMNLVLAVERAAESFRNGWRRAWQDKAAQSSGYGVRPTGARQLRAYLRERGVRAAALGSMNGRTTSSKRAT